VDFHAEHPEPVDRQRHQDVRGNRQPGERPGPALADEQQSGDNGEGSHQAAERGPPRHLGKALPARQRMRNAHQDAGKQRHYRQKRDEARKPRILERIPERVVHGRTPRLQGARDEDDRIEPERADILHSQFLRQNKLSASFDLAWLRSYAGGG
jgi:hypothetical protein